MPDPQISRPETNETMSGLPPDSENFSLYAVDRDNDVEQQRADSIARLGATDALDPGTFFPPERQGKLDFGAAWNDWLEVEFENWLGERFIAIHLAAAHMQSDRIAEIDREIDTRLPEAARKRGRKAARPYLEGRSEVRRQPQWVKFLRAHETGEIPGQLTSIFALQSALFHLPLLPALTAYVTLEGANGFAAMAGGKRLDSSEFLARYPESAETARRVFRNGVTGLAGNSSDNDSDDTPGHLACV